MYKTLICEQYDRFFNRRRPQSPIRRILIQLLRFCTAFGIDPAVMLHAMRGSARFAQTGMAYARSHSGQQFRLSLPSLYPCLIDYKEPAGITGGHYFHQDLWAARKIYHARPSCHLDIGSRIDGFIAHLLAFMPVAIIDIRRLESDVEGLTFIQADATNLKELPDRSVESLSSLHAVEHFGLGRFGDPVDPEAPFKAMRALARILRPGGRLYFSVPVGIERLEFNAHRVFAPETVLEVFSHLELRSFAAVDDSGRYIPSTSPGDLAQARYACGMFEFTRT
jgi:SAM-dependent methyltransferase